MLRDYCPIVGRRDIEWKWDNNKVFKVNSLNEKFLADGLPLSLPKSVMVFIWMKVSPPRVHLLLWQIAHGKLMTGKLLVGLGIVESSQATCPFCSNHLESINHVLFTYPYA